MQINELRDMAQQACLPYGNQLGAVLANAAAGKTVYIIGSGPSANEFTAELRAKAKAEGAWVIATNAMVLYAPEPDIWITSEATIGKLNDKNEPCFPWFYQAQDFRGLVVWERHCVIRDEVAGIDRSYSDDFLRRIIWHCRFHWRPYTSIRNIGKVAYNGYKNDGLWYMEHEHLAHKVNGAHNEPLGTVLLQALHLAGIMGAAKIVIYGGELMFKDGQQHAYGDNPYSEGNGLTGVVNFTLANGEPVLKPSGEYESTRFFIESSYAIRQVIAQARRDHPDLVIEDRSCGLLDPAQIGVAKPPDADDYLADKPKRERKRKIDGAE